MVMGLRYRSLMTYLIRAKFGRHGRWATWLCCAVLASGCGKHTERPSATSGAGAGSVVPTGSADMHGASPAPVGVPGEIGSATMAVATTLTTVGPLQLVMMPGPPVRFLVRDTAQSFEMPFPAQPELSSLPFTTAAGAVEGVQVFVENDGVAITLVRLPLPTAQGQPLDAAGLQLAYDGMRDQGASNLGGTVLENQDVKIGVLPARRIALRVQSKAQVVLQMQWLVYQPSQQALYMIGATYREADAARVLLVVQALVAQLQISP